MVHGILRLIPGLSNAYGQALQTSWTGHSGNMYVDGRVIFNGHNVKFTTAQNSRYDIFWYNDIDPNVDMAFQIYITPPASSDTKAFLVKNIDSIGVGARNHGYDINIYIKTNLDWDKVAGKSFLTGVSYGGGRINSHITY